MLTKRIRKFFGTLKDNSSGNAMLLMAMGMPVLIGTSGMAVDFAQWYMWKRELQYAVDQAAIAGAWARAEAATQDDYVTRASQEFSANLGYLKGKTTTPATALADYNGGTDNSVTVSASTSVTLPFSQMLINSSTTIGASAQASFEAATNWTTCVLALDPDESGALEFGGSNMGNITCGTGALSTNDEAVIENGNPSISISDIIASGGIDNTLIGNGSVHEFISNLSNPFEGLTPPTDATPRSYECVSTTTTKQVPNDDTTVTASVTKLTVTEYTYWQGNSQTNANTKVTFENALADTSESADIGIQNVSKDAQEGIAYVHSTSSTWTGRSWDASGSNKKIYEYKTVTEFYTPTGISYSGPMDTVNVTVNKANLLPGTYSSDITIGCETHFAPGVYTFSGQLDMGQNKSVTGDDVLMVFTGTGTERFKLNSNSRAVMSGITGATLVNTYGVDEEVAAILAGMLIWDPNSTSSVSINGGANMLLDGTVYMPQRDVTFNGNSAVSGNCMMLAAGTITFSGSSNLSSFCVPKGVQSFDIGGTTISIRLVS